MTVKTRYRKEAEPVIASMTFTDIITGQGFVQFLAYTTKDSSGSGYHLTTNGSLASRDIEITMDNTADRKFDSAPFKDKLIAEGVASLTYSIGPDAANLHTIVWTIYHVRGVTATSIGTVTSETYNGAGSNQSMAVEVTIAKTNFTKGDFIRVRAVVTTNGGNWVMGGDPASRAGTILADATAPTRTSFWIPFNTDL